MPTEPSRQALESSFFEDWRREQAQSVKDLRREWAETLVRIDLRLTGIESRMNESQSVMERHDLKITEIAESMTEVERRVVGLEGNQRDREIRAQLEKELSEQRKAGLGLTAVTTVVCTTVAFATTIVLGGIAAFIVWLIKHDISP